MSKPIINHTEDDTIVIEYKGKRYELYFDEIEYCIFIGEQMNGSLVKINSVGDLKYYPKF